VDRIETSQLIHARGSICESILRVRLWLRIEQIKLKVIGLVPRHAHECILPLR
jgi:hypothetical protein